MNTLDFITRLGLALFLGAAIGFERQWRQKSAGLRTNTLVSMGAAAFTLISFALISQDDGVYKGDATRIIGQIVTGIGFLGGGVILREGLNVQGLNTAATILTIEYGVTEVNWEVNGQHD
ncbi:MAG: MgtC/SapB family protein [Candidatus Thermochlorobacter aerophilum]|jgi:putative Mg2+ transporter-C (MgtC) family protein|uniref:MgtC/SapB family protein n=1 Tax=Candidatus Thermochlorobacter aerophilus TaxID=1868324 RepID=A0A395M1V8_9BACT|nr:MAG: MgtC/SapB family protein [Candidatus Thermochlorobacter aerophilum]